MFKKIMVMVAIFAGNNLCASCDQPSLDKIEVTILSQNECLPVRSEISLQQKGYPEWIRNISSYNDTDRSEKIEQLKKDYLQHSQLRLAVALKK